MDFIFLLLAFTWTLFLGWILVFKTAFWVSDTVKEGIYAWKNEPDRNLRPWFRGLRKFFKGLRKFFRGNPWP